MDITKKTPPAAPGIRVLPRLLVDQIAAGEVVERPASVVRELLDNAIDAGAANIEIELREGGRELIRVSDDGCGIRLADLALAFASHATSKLSEVEDLQQIATLGFRGEALASIGAVARVKLRTFSSGDAHGGEIEDEGGTLTLPKPAARSRGTDVEVRDLFYNVPARRRFLRRDSTEAGHAIEVALRHALARPEIHIKLIVNGKTLYDFAAARSLITESDIQQSRLERIRAAFGASVADDLTPVGASGREIGLSGFCGGPASSRADGTGIQLFLNGRFIKDRGLARVMRDATRDVLGQKQPTAFLFVSMDPALVDVNVHPAKLEVRFRTPSSVYGAIHRAVRAALESSRPASPAELLLRPTPASEWNRQSAGAARAAESLQSTGFAVRETPADAGLFINENAEPLVPRGARFLRAFDTFLVVESERGIDIIDQHALHERVNFERLKRAAALGDSPRQQLLIPEIVDIDHGDAGVVEELQQLWLRAGLDVSLHSPSTAAIRATPLGLKYTAPADLLHGIIQLAKDHKKPSHDGMLEEVLHRCACHASVKAGDRLSDEEIGSLLLQASRLPADQTCPHGRPTRIRFTLRDLERAFERK